MQIDHVQDVSIECMILNLQELWCDHDPKPDGINDRRIIGEWGTCEYWEEWKY